MTSVRFSSLIPSVILLRFPLPVLASTVVVLSAPFTGQARAWLRAAFPGQFVLMVGGGVALALAGAMFIALRRIRDRRAPRYALVASALVIAAAYSAWTATGAPEVDSVERFHFIEYGVIAWLFYRATKPAGDPSIVVLPMLAGLIVGTFDEWLQWFIPNRVGEAKDVLLNLVAIGCGLLFMIGADPPKAFNRTLRPGSRRRIGVVAGMFVVVFALFVNAVHAGHELSRDGIIFRSHYSTDELTALAADRVERWKTNPPIKLIRLSREDQYMDEGLWHVRRRNAAWTAGEYWVARQENRILETFYAPVLDTPSYVSPSGNRWPDSQRQDAEARAAGDRGPYVSDAEPYPILVWK